MANWKWTLVCGFTLFACFLTPSICQIVGTGKKLVCLDNKGDVVASLWTAAGVEIGTATSVTSLPKGWGDLKGLASGSGDIWWMEGPPTTSGGSKDTVFKAPLNLYPSRARSVLIYIKYATNSQRRLSLFPVKEGSGAGSSPTSGTLQLLPLPPKGQALTWIEVRKEINPMESPLEITSHLASKEWLIFDKIIVAVDTPLPTDVGISCGVMRNPPVLGSPSGQGQGSPWPTPGAPTPTARTGSISPTTQTSTAQCPTLPVVPECKCNCLCNCSKC